MKRRVIRASTDSSYADQVCQKLQALLSRRGVSEVSSVYGTGDPTYLNICVEVNIGGYSGAFYCVFADGEPDVNIDPVRPSGDVLSIQTYRDYMAAAGRMTDIYTTVAFSFRSCLL